MNFGFEVVAARSKKAGSDDAVPFEPMRQRARKEPRKQPSTDEKKVKRRLTKSAVAWTRKDSLDHDTEFVRYVLLSDTEALEASVIRDETTDEPTWAWLVSVIDRQDGGILEFVMSGSASGLDEAKGKADVALDRAEMDMMFDRVGSRKQAASDHQETIWHLTGYLMGYNGDAQPDDDAPFALMVGYAAGADDNEDNKPAQYTRSDLDYVTETEHMSSDDVADFFEKRGSHKEASMPIMVPSIEDLPADREDMAWYEVTSQRRSSGQLVLEVEWAGHSATQAKRAADELLSDPDVMFVQLTRNAGRETYGVQMTASRKHAAKNYYLFDEYPDENGNEERPVAGPFASAEEASAALKDVAYPFQFPYGPAIIVGDLFMTQDFINQTLSSKHAAKNYYLFDEYPDENGNEERPVAGPFASAEEASAALKDVAYPFQFPYGPAIIVGDLFIASGLPQMDTQDFINQTLSSKHTGYNYQPDTESSFDVEQYDESPGEPFTNPAGHTYSGPEAPEAISNLAGRSSSMQREADILNAMRFASLGEQRTLMAELNTLRARRTAAVTADREVDYTSAVIRDRLTPVLTKSMHTTATDWLDEVMKDDEDDEKSDKEAAREMVAQATVWFKRLSSEVVADRDEFAEQARGKARQLTSSLGTRREAAIASFLDAAAHLRSKRANEMMGYDDMGMSQDPGMVMEEVPPATSEDPGMDPRFMARRKRSSRKTASRPLYEIADEIRRDWRNVNYGAAPYLDAMQSLTSINDMYFADTAKSIVAYFLSNASSWKGETAKAVKAELKQMMKSGSRRATRKTAEHWVSADSVRVGDEIDVTTLEEGIDTDMPYWNVTKVTKDGDGFVYIEIDATNPASEDEGVYFVVPLSTEVLVVSDHLASRRKQAVFHEMYGDDWDDDSREDVDTDDMLRFLQEEPQYLPEITGMTWQGMRDWYARKYDYFADVWGLAIDPDTIDWEFISENMPKTGKRKQRKRRATRKTSADMSSLEMYDSYYEQVADSVAGAKVDPSGSGVIVGGVSYKVMRNRDSGSVYLQASNGRTLSIDDAQVDPRVGMPFYGDVADVIEYMARNASRKRGSRKTAQKVRCPECGRVFDLMNESDADEWFSGHDCEG